MSAPKDAALLEAVRARLWAGETLVEAARALGASKDTVRGLIRRHGRGPPPPAPPRPEFILHTPRDGGCAFPLSSGRPWRFCPEPRLPGRVYCAHHLRICIHGRVSLEHSAPLLATPA